MKKIKTGSDILQGQALFREVKHLLIRGQKEKKKKEEKKKRKNRQMDKKKKRQTDKKRQIKDRHLREIIGG